jgi:hypothetical protein
MILGVLALLAAAAAALCTAVQLAEVDAGQLQHAAVRQLLQRCADRMQLPCC